MSVDLKASGLVSVAILGSRLLGLVRQIVFAALFGVGMVADVFEVAFRIPNLFRDLLAEGALSSAFVPTFTATLKQEGKDAAYHLGNLMFGGVLALTGALTLLGVVFADTIVALISGFGADPHKLRLAVRLTQLMMPFLCFVSLAAVWMGMLNAQRRFVVPALAPAMFNVASLSAGVVVWVLGWSAETAIFVWASGTLTAGLAQAGMQWIALFRLGYRPWPKFRGMWQNAGIRRVGKLMAPAVVGVAAVQLNVIINTRFSGQLGDGAVTQLSYAFRLFFLPLGMFGVALATVTTTSVSEAAAAGDHGELAKRAGGSLSAAWMLAGASAVGLWVLAEPVCWVVYRAGETTTDDTIAIAACLQSYVLGLLPYSAIKILAPAFYAIDRPRTPFIASVCGVLSNVVFNSLTYQTLGAPGIAIGTALGATVNLLVLRIMFHRQMGSVGTEHRVRQAAGLALGLAVLGGVSYGGRWGIEQMHLHGWGSKAAVASALGCIIAVAFVVYALVLRAFGYPGAAMLLGLPGSLLRRVRRALKRS